jgi:hypothetical protein
MIFKKSQNLTSKLLKVIQTNIIINIFNKLFNYKSTKCIN